MLFHVLNSLSYLFELLLQLKKLVVEQKFLERLFSVTILLFQDSEGIQSLIIEKASWI